MVKFKNNIVINCKLDGASVRDNRRSLLVVIPKNLISKSIDENKVNSDKNETIIKTSTANKTTKSTIILRKNLEIMNNPNKINILNWNANGIFHKKYELEELLHRKSIDVRSITETRLSHKKSVKFNNYNCYRTNRANSNGGGGVLLLVNKKFNSVENVSTLT